MTKVDEYWMRCALSLAESAASYDEVPVGAIIVKENSIISTGLNCREGTKCSTGHAEIVAIEAANKNLKNWRLVDCTLYVTLEPCLMCAGAIINSRIAKIVYGAQDQKSGAMGSLYNIAEDTRLNHNPIVQSGVLEDDCSKILSAFFKKKRDRRR